MHKWLQLPATTTDDPLATVYPINYYKKSHVYAVTRINPIYVDDDHHGTWNKSGSSGYESHPHSDHSSLDKNSPSSAKYLRNGTGTKTPPSSPSDRSSGGSVHRTTAPWLSPIKEGVIDVHQYCIPRPVWPGLDDFPQKYPDPERIPRVKCCRRCSRCRCRSASSGGSSNGSGGSSNGSGGRSNGSGGTGSNGSGGTGSNGSDSNDKIVGGSYSGYSSGGGTISTTSGGGGRGGIGSGSCSDDASPSSGTPSVKSANPQSPLTLDPRFVDEMIADKTLANTWDSVDLRLNQKTDNLHYDCGAMLRGLQFTLDAQQAEKLMQKIKVGKKHKCWCRLVTACLGLIMFLVSVITVSLALTRGQKMFGSL